MGTVWVPTALAVAPQFKSAKQDEPVLGWEISNEMSQCGKPTANCSVLSKEALDGSTFQRLWKSSVLTTAPTNHPKATSTAAALTITTHQNLDQKSTDSVSEHSHCPHNHEQSKQPLPCSGNTPGIGIYRMDIKPPLMEIHTQLLSPH